MSEQAKVDQKTIDELQAKRKKKEKKNDENKPGAGTIIFRVLAVVVAVVYFVLLIFGKSIIPQHPEFLDDINVFSKTAVTNNWIRIVSLCIVTLSFSSILRFFIGRLAKNKNVTKRTGVAVIELLGSLVKYAAFLVLVFLILSAVGVNTGELLAGLGILGLILGLGVTSLIEDIVAGIFIIAEHLFDVGDVIVVNGFRGTVVRIGIRSTQIMDVGGDDMILRNSSIGSVINLTYRMSCAAVTFPLAPTESVEKVAEIVKNSDFEHLGEKYPALQSDPMYLGMCGMDSKGVQNLLLIASCKEQERYDVERILFKEFKLLMEQGRRNGNRRDLIKRRQRHEGKRIRRRQALERISGREALLLRSVQQSLKGQRIQRRRSGICHDGQVGVSPLSRRRRQSR